MAEYRKLCLISFLFYTFNDTSALLSRIEHCMRESSHLSDSFHFFSSQKRKKMSFILDAYCNLDMPFTFFYLEFGLAQGVKNLPAMQETWVWTLGQEDPWIRKWQPTPVFLSGKSHGWRSLVGYSPWGRKEWDMPEQLTLNDQDSLSVVKSHTMSDLGKFLL